MKKILSSLLCTTMLLGLASCGDSSSSNAPANIAQNSAAKTPVISSSTDASKQGSSSLAKASSSNEGGVLIVCFSATGNTKAVAEMIANTTGGELYEIVPQVPYTADDLNWGEPSSRSSKEHDDPSIRPAISGEAKDLSSYETILIGYPIWWGEAPNIVWNFVENNDLSGKTVIPFATSSSSGFGSSGETLMAFAPDANWLAGQRFASGAGKEDVENWVRDVL